MVTATKSKTNITLSTIQDVIALLQENEQRGRPTKDTLEWDIFFAGNEKWFIKRDFQVTATVQSMDRVINNYRQNFYNYRKRSKVNGKITRRGPVVVIWNLDRINKTERDLLVKNGLLD